MIYKYHGMKRVNLKKKKRERGIGLEIELVFKPEDREKALNIIGSRFPTSYWIAEYDCSVDVELVSHIISFEMLDSILKEIKELFKILRKERIGIITGNSSIHVNVGRKPKDNVLKIQQEFLKNKKILFVLGGKHKKQIRKYSTFEYDPRNLINKYVALLTKRDRFEFRLFRTTLSIHMIKKYVILCKHIVEQCTLAPESMDEKLRKWFKEYSTLNVASFNLSLDTLCKIRKILKSKNFKGLVEINRENLDSGHYEIIEEKDNNYDYTLIKFSDNLSELEIMQLLKKSL